MRWLVALLALLFVAGCSSDAASQATVRAMPSPRGPGTPLADGFTVPAGTRLVGPVFRVPDGPWEALLVLDADADPIAVYDAVVDQARAMGIPLPGSGAVPPNSQGQLGPPCHLDLRDRPAPLGSADPAQARALTCEAAAAGSGPGHSLAVTVRWGDRTRHAYLTGGVSGTTVDAGTTRATHPTQLPPVGHLAQATAPGMKFGADHDAFERGAYRRFRLEPGSRLAAPAGFHLDNDDFAAVLWLSGDPEKVLQGYADQLGVGGRVPPIEHPAVPGGRVLEVVNAPTGGGYARLVTDPSYQWLLVTTHSD